MSDGKLYQFLGRDSVGLRAREITSRDCTFESCRFWKRLRKAKAIEHAEGTEMSHEDEWETMKLLLGEREHE